MKTWQKALIVFAGCGLQGVCTYLTSIYPVWATVLGGAIIVITGTVYIITGFPSKEDK